MSLSPSDRTVIEDRAPQFRSDGMMNSDIFHSAHHQFKAVIPEDAESIETPPTKTPITTQYIFEIIIW